MQDISNEDLDLAELRNEKRVADEESADKSFEEVVESREMIQERITAIKCRMVDFTVRQWDIQQAIVDMEGDIKTFESKIDQTLEEQQTAIENDDYEKADALDSKIQQTKRLIEAKEYKIRQLEENNLTQELMKADKWQELSQLMHKSIFKVSNLRALTKREHRDFRKEKKAAVETLESHVRKETARIGEENQLNDEVRATVQRKIDEVEKLVYEDTVDQHQEKNRLDDQIEEMDKDIEELERMLERKKKERNMLVLEKEVQERRIQQARMKYQDRISITEEQMLEVSTTQEGLEAKQAAVETEQERLDAIKSELEGNVQSYSAEKANLKSLQSYLLKTSKLIDKTNQTKKEMRHRQKEISEQHN